MRIKIAKSDSMHICLQQFTLPKEYNIELMYKYVQNVIEMFEDTK